MLVLRCSGEEFPCHLLSLHVRLLDGFFFFTLIEGTHPFLTFSAWIGMNLSLSSMWTGFGTQRHQTFITILHGQFWLQNLQESLCNQSHNNLLIPMIPMVPVTCLEVHWMMRTGSCRYFCLHEITCLGLRIMTRMIWRWKAMSKENSAPKRSWESAT